jgi:hypothetical protein
MSSLRVDTIATSDKTVAIAAQDLRGRVIRTISQDYTGGTWDPNTGYQWAPGLWYDYTFLASSGENPRVRFTTNFSVGFIDGHNIMHCIMYSAGTERGRHCITSQNYETRHAYMWDVPFHSGNQRIGYQMRWYGTGNRTRLHATGYWDGNGSTQFCTANVTIEEYLPV